MEVAIETSVLKKIEDRVLWLSTAMIDHANRVRPNKSGLKVGGHQASSASLVSIMTALWFKHLRPEDRVSVKPHASPVLHAINYLLGELEPAYLTTLREFGGLQSYPSRTKDPDPVDYSTGSVGLGATATIWGALARRYVSAHFGGMTSGRQYALLGDAELDEGACWEAILDPLVSELGELVWIVDLNRQSLDRVVPHIAAARLAGMFSAAGWQVATVKYGGRLEALFQRHGGEVIRRRIDEMSNPEYQRLLRLTPDELRDRLARESHESEAIATALSGVTNEELHSAFRDLGGHDQHFLDAAFAQIDDTRPTVILAYTVKGYGLASAGHPQNHSALLTEVQLAELAHRVGADINDPWARWSSGSPEVELCRSAAARLNREDRQERTSRISIPDDLGRTPQGTATTQAALGRTLVDLAREAPEVAKRIVTVSPDVSSSTNLGAWVNKVGVWASTERPNWFSDDGETILHWRERPTGRHVELGIAETNLVGLLGELGATWSRWGEPLLPIGVVYDPFVGRALEPWAFGIYAGGQSILVGTPSGVTLSPEGGAHQSITTPSIGLEQPGCVTYEPAFAVDTEWILLACLQRLGHSGGTSAYIRLSTRPIDQSLAEVPTDPAARERRRRQVVAGAYRLQQRQNSKVVICAVGALVPEALQAAERLEALDIPADVVCITSPDLLFRATQARHGRDDAPSWILDAVLPRHVPTVTVMDGHPHTLAFLGSDRPATHLGVTQFGQSGDLADVLRHHEIDAQAIVASALDILDRSRPAAEGAG